MSSFVLLGSIASIISAVSSVISIVVLAFVLLGAFLAYRRGFARSALRLDTLIATIVLAVIGTSFLKGLVGGFFEGTVNDVLAEEGLTSITEASPTMTELIKGLPGALAGPFVFLVLFIILNIIFLIIYNILKRIPVFKRTIVSKRVDHLLGMVVGAVCTLLLISSFLIPVSGYVNVADDVLTNVEHTDLDQESAQEILDIHQNYVTPFADNTAFSASNFLLGSVVFERLFACEVQGDTVNLVDEIAYLTKTYTTMTPLIDVDFEFSRFEKEQGDALRKFANDFDKSVLVPHILCEILPEAADNWNNGEEFGGISNPADSSPENLQSLMNNTIGIMETTTKDTIKGDLVTLCELLATMAENGTLASLENAGSNEILKTLSDPGVVSGLMDILYENERTRILVADLSNLGFDAIGESLNIPETDEEVREQLVADLNEAITKAEGFDTYDAKVEDLSNSIANIFTEYGMEATEEEAKLYAEAIIGYGPLTSAGEGETAADSYFAIIGAAIADVNGTASAGGVTLLSNAVESDERTEKLHALIRDYQAKNGDISLAGTQNLTNMINGNADLVHKMVTWDQIHVVENELFSGNDELFHNQTLALEEIIIVLSDALKEDGDGFSFDYKTIDTKALSAALHKLAGTRKDADGNELQSLGTALSNVIKHTLQQTGIDAVAAEELVDHIVEKEKDSTDGKKDTLSAAFSLVTVFENESDNEGMKEHVSSLMQDLNGDSAKVLSNCVSPNLVGKYTTGNVNKERTDAICHVTKDLLDNFGNHSDDLTEEQLDAEATYMQTIFTLATVADDGNAKKLFSTDANQESKLGKTADEFVASVNNSVVISETVLGETDALQVAIGDKMNSDDKTALKIAIDNNTELSSDLRNALTTAFSLNNMAEQ
ncbi:MAG: CvpA family protein [Clostridia bacterium]|nr:CvpA family protein [Clostridia bacterium]